MTIGILLKVHPDRQVRPLKGEDVLPRAQVH
jgi:hypothetical protein